ncbi:hypothetical protein D3C87_2098000 [compost metagenome]
MKAVTTTGIVFSPLLSVMGDEALPLVTLTPLTVTMAVLSLTTGVTVVEVTLLATLAV